MTQSKAEAVRGAVESLVRALQDMPRTTNDDYNLLYPTNPHFYIPLSCAVHDLLLAIGHPKAWIGGQWTQYEYWHYTLEEGEPWLDAAFDVVKEEVKDQEEARELAHEHEIADLEHKVTYWRERAEAAEKALPRKPPVFT